MKFHGITMTGPFVNQKLTVLPTFDQTRDQGRLVWLTDGTLWYGDLEEWVSFSSGAGDANEVEDMYSDLLRTTIFMNASYDEFAEEDLVASTTMTYVPKYKWYTYSGGQTIESVNLYDNESDEDFVDYVLVSVDYIDAGEPTIEVSSNGGVNWFTVQNNKVYRIPNAYAGTDLRLRFTAVGTGTLKSWGVLYNKDLTAACTKYGLTYNDFTATENQTTITLDYYPNAIQVFLNGDLLDINDYTASSGTEIVFAEPLHEGDLVYVISYSTSILNPNIDFDDFIRRDGTVPYIADQPMNGNKLIGLEDGVDDNDSVNMGQLNAMNLNILKAIILGTWEGDYHIEYTSDVNELITDIDIWIPSYDGPAPSTNYWANVNYTYNAAELPTTVVYTFDGQTVTQTYVFDANDLPTSLTQVTT